MKLTFNWLKEWVDTKLNAQQLAQKLTMSGLEVESLSALCDDFSGVVVGKILTCYKHENADKLKVCNVSIGSGKPLQIICGANNARAGIVVAVAKVGAKLAKIDINKVKLRGIDSFGMLCSAEELGLNSDLFADSGILELPENLTLGHNLVDALNLDDKILTLDITPNRGDCLSVLGISREVANYENLELKMPMINNIVQINAKKTIYLKQPKACPNYLCRIVKGINNTIKTPQWILAKLIYSGQKPHSLVVDITNFVLLELGQPLHAFDLDKINGDISIDFNSDKHDVELLDGTNITLDANTLIIKDEKSVLALAGIMGAMASSTSAKTTNILLESAFFTPNAIASKARSYGLHTESSLRFERGVDFNGQKYALERATQLIAQIAGGEVGSIETVISKTHLPQPNSIYLKKDNIKKMLGIYPANAWIMQKFSQLGCQIDSIGDSNFKITAPSFRFDISIEEDLIEEIARLHGYDKLPTKTLTFKVNTNKLSTENNLQNQLLVCGYSEVINYSFISKKWHKLLYKQQALELANPLSQEMTMMRCGLLAGLLQTTINNQRYGQKSSKIFETGICFFGLKPEEQIEKIAGVINGNYYPKNWLNKDRLADFYDLKGDVENLLSICKLPYNFTATNQSILHPKQGADIILDGNKIGFLGALSPNIEAKLKLNNVFVFEMEVGMIKNKAKINYQPFSTQQDVKRDISILIDKKISFDEVKNTIFALKQQFLVDLCLFDVYTDTTIAKNKHSLSITLTYQSSKTLLDEEVDGYVGQIIKTLTTRYSIIQR